MSANVPAMIEQGKRALREGNRSEAQQLLLRATELDEQNEEAWLWLASAVDDIEEKRICLENVQIINPNNQEAKRMLAELDRSSGTPAVDAAAFGGFTDAPAGPRDTSAQPVVEFGDDDPFGDIFSSSGFDVGDDGTSKGPFAADFDFATSSQDNDPFGSSADSAPVVDDPMGDLSSLYDDNDDDLFSDSAPAAQAAPRPAVTDDEDDESFDDMGLFDDRAGVSGDGLFADGTASNVDILADDDDFYDDEFDDEVDHLTLLPDNIRPTRLPGTDETIGTGVVVGIVVLAVLNVVAIAGLILQLVL